MHQEHAGRTWPQLAAEGLQTHRVLRHNNVMHVTLVTSKNWVDNASFFLKQLTSDKPRSPVLLTSDKPRIGANSPQTSLASQQARYCYRQAKIEQRSIGASSRPDKPGSSMLPMDQAHLGQAGIEQGSCAFGHAHCRASTDPGPWLSKGPSSGPCPCPCP